jgi:O-antigen/teichoic acid export membrane protein
LSVTLLPQLETAEGADVVAAEPTGVTKTISLRRAGLLYGSSSMVANLLGYAFLVILSRGLSQSDFGAFGALLGVAIIGTILYGAVQLVIARQTASGHGDSRGSVVSARAVGLLSLAAAGVVWVATPVLVHYLHLNGPWPVLWLGASLIPMTVLGALVGHLLGAERFARLAVATVLVATARLVAGGVAAVEGWGVSGTLAAVAIATALVTVLVAALADVRWWWYAREWHWRRDTREVADAATKTAAFLVLSGLDVLLARHYLPRETSGLYALGSVFAKAGFWGPQFIAVVVFPRLSAARTRRVLFRQAVLATAAFGLVIAGLAAAFATPAIRFTSSETYVPVATYAAGFALLGTVLALVYVGLVTSVALGDRLFGLLLWLGVGAEIVLVSRWHASIREILACCLVVAAVLSVVGALRVHHRDRKAVADEVEVDLVVP